MDLEYKKGKQEHVIYFEFVSYSKLNSPQNWGDLYDHLIRKRQSSQIDIQ